MQTQQALPTGTHPHSIPEAPEAPGALSPDLQKVKLGFQPSRRFNDFAREPKERREAERSSTSCLVTGGGGGTRDGETGFYFILFLTRPFLHFQETQIPPVASAAPDPVQMAGRNPASSTTELLDEPTSKKGSQAAGKGATQSRRGSPREEGAAYKPRSPFPFKIWALLPGRAGSRGSALPAASPDLSIPAACVWGRAEGSHSQPQKCQALAAGLGAGRVAGSPRGSETRLQLIRSRTHAVRH